MTRSSPSAQDSFVTPDRRDHFRSAYRDGLLNDTLPFWLPRSIDQEHGGYFTAFDRDGTLLQADKPVWFQGRFAWLLSTLYLTLEQRPEWLTLARHGIGFLERHCFDADGRMFFLVTREGKPLRKRRYVFSELFAVVALAAYGRATSDARYVRRAADLFRAVLRWRATPGLLPPKVDPATRPQKGLAVPMMLVVTAQELRKADPSPLWDEVVAKSIAEVERDFVKADLGCVLETVGPHGEFVDTMDGRQVNPGHAIEAAWFILEEARHRGGDARLTQLGLRILDWSLDLGWDAEHGGLYHLRDARRLPCPEPHHDMKYWWPHTEAIIATLMAYRETGDARYAEWHERIHEWAHAHFPDREHGEWFGYLHRNGTVATPIKGGVWKGPFHLPRMQWLCWRLLETWPTRTPHAPVRR